MSAGDSGGLNLQSLPSLLLSDGDADIERRYHRALHGIAHLTSELTLMLSGLQVHVSEDLKFIMTERADLKLQRAALHEEKECHAKVIEAVEVGVQVNASRAEAVEVGVQVNAAKVATEDEKVVVISPPREVEKLSLAASTRQRTPLNPEPATGKRGLEKHPHMTPKLIAAHTGPQGAAQSLGRLPAWLSAGERGIAPGPQRPQDFKSGDRRAWLEMKGEQAHRFMMNNQEDRSKDVGCLDDSEGSGASGNDGILSSDGTTERRVKASTNARKFDSAS